MCRGGVRPREELRTGRQVYLCDGCGTVWHDHVGAALLRLAPRLEPVAEPLGDLARRGGHLPLKLGRRSPRSEFRQGIRPDPGGYAHPSPFLGPHTFAAERTN